MENVRNARYINDLRTHITCEVVRDGQWVGITITADRYPLIWEAAQTTDVADYAPPTDAELLVEWRQTAVMTRREFCLAARQLGLLDRSDAVAAAQGAWPTAFEPALDQLSEDEADAALITWASLTHVQRNDPLFEGVRIAMGIAPETADQLFGWPGA